MVVFFGKSVGMGAFACTRVVCRGEVQLAEKNNADTLRSLRHQDAGNGSVFIHRSQKKFSASPTGPPREARNSSTLLALCPVHVLLSRCSYRGPLAHAFASFSTGEPHMWKRWVCRAHVPETVLAQARYYFSGCLPLGGRGPRGVWTVGMDLVSTFD